MFKFAPNRYQIDLFIYLQLDNLVLYILLLPLIIWLLKLGAEVRGECQCFVKKQSSGDYPIAVSPGADTIQASVLLQDRYWKDTEIQIIEPITARSWGIAGDTPHSSET